MPPESASRNRRDDASLDLLESTAEAAFVADEKHRIVVWNRAATTLFGFKADDVVGRRCHRVVRGIDPSGSRFCSESCAVRQMARRHEAIHVFPLQVPSASGPTLTIDCSVVVMPGSRPRGRRFIHLLLPGARDREPGGAARSSPESATPSAPSDPDPGKALSSGCPRALTLRETQVLRLAAIGTGTAEIASLLSISPVTVRNHIQHILDKLEVHSKLHAIIVAHRLNLI